MAKINGDDPAMPRSITHTTMGDLEWGNEGLTIRQQFAAMAMQALLSDIEVQRWMQADPRYTGNNFKNVVAVNSIEFADALIVELNKEN